MAGEISINKVAIIGAGGMGSMMTLLFAEHDCDVVIEDPSEKARTQAIDNARALGFTEQRIRAAAGYGDLFEFLKGQSPRLIVFSLPHGRTVDSVIEGLKPHLAQGDIILDCSNENWQRTQRRQGELLSINCSYIGCGVSGGYQSARAGPSMCPGGEESVVRRLLPWMEKVAAKDHEGRPCVQYIGAGGAGHYVKMLHNGIEQGMLSSLCEVWFIMRNGLGMDSEEIAQTFKQWDAAGELRDNFLVSIGVGTSNIKDPKDGEYVLSKVKDKVVQDADESEGTGYWTLETAADLHAPIQTISAGHNFRIASADAQQRLDVKQALGGPLSRPTRIKTTDRTAFLELLRLACFAAFISSYIQGMECIRKANHKYQWGINFASVISIWKAGCIIRSGYITDILQPVYEKDNDASILVEPSIVTELKKTYQPLKDVVLAGVEADMVIPTLSQTLEYIKTVSTSEDLPTQFQEAQLDYFGKHMFDLRSDPPGKPVTGKEHFEWLPARGITDRQ